jgi:hypothetical protein
MSWITPAYEAASEHNPSLGSNPRLDLLSLFAFGGIAKPLK